MTAGSEYARFYIYATTVVASLGSFNFGYGMGVMNTILEIISAQLDWTCDEKKVNFGLISSLVAPGAAVGALLSGYLTSKLGRRNSLIITDILTIISCIPLLISNTILIFIGRFLYGIIVGLNSAIVPLYIKEMSPVQISGGTGAIAMVLLHVGVLIAFVFGFGNPDTGSPEFLTSMWWKFMLGFPIIIALIRLVMLILVFRLDTPSYLYSINNQEDCKKILSKIYNPNQVENMMNSLKPAENQVVQKIGIKDLFGSRYKKAFVVGLLLSFFQQFVGINAVIFFSSKIFAGVGSSAPEEVIDEMGRCIPQPTGDESTLNLLTTLVGVALTCGCITMSIIIEKLGRKKMFLVGVSLALVSILLLSIFILLESGIAKIFVFTYVFFFGSSLGPVFFIYVAEILPDIGIAVVVLSNWIEVLIIGFFFPIVADPSALGAGWTFLFFTFIAIIAVIYILLFVKETQGKSPTEIEALFDSTKKSNSEQKPTLKEQELETKSNNLNQV